MTKTLDPPLELSIAGLNHDFGALRVLADVSLQLFSGEILCLVGPSGCGKTTLLRLIAGLEPVQTGSILMQGETIATAANSRPPEQRGIGLVFQDFALFPHLSILDNLCFGLIGLPRHSRKAHALAMLARVGLTDRAQDFPHMLSGGQQQRVALARALAPQPRLLLLDEPFCNLDVRLRHRTRLDTVHLLKASGMTSILVTHDPEEAMFVADRIALMQDGRILQIGSPEDLYRHPASPFAAEFFGDVNRLQATVSQGEVVTPLAILAAPGLAEGSRAQILIRPEAIKLTDENGPQALAALVTEVHMLGAQSMVGLRIMAAGELFELQMQLASDLLPAPGARIHVQLDRPGVFVYAA